MLLRTAAFAPATLMLFVSAGSSSAGIDGLFPSDSCAIVIASEKSIPQLINSPALARLPNQEYWIFETANGVFAAVIGAAPLDGREAVIGELLENGVVESDAFCSHPDKLVHLAAEPPQLPIPFYGEMAAAQATGTLPPPELRAPKEVQATTPGVPQWVTVPTLTEHATIDEWLRASNAVKLSSAAYYTNSMIQSNEILTAMVLDGSLLAHMRETVTCTDQMVRYIVETNQKEATDKIAPVTVVCAALTH